MSDKLLQTLGIEKEYIELYDKRTDLINKVLDKMTNWDEFFDYYKILEELLPIGKWANNMPTTVKLYLEDKDFLHKESTLYYDTICSWMDEHYRDEDLLNEVKDYIKENMICGTTYDW